MSTTAVPETPPAVPVPDAGHAAAVRSLILDRFRRLARLRASADHAGRAVTLAVSLMVREEAWPLLTLLDSAGEPDEVLAAIRAAVGEMLR